jgi:hypothetical protein
MASDDEQRDHGAAQGDGGALPASEDRILTHRVGWVAGVEAGTILVDFRGNARGPVPARATVAIDPTAALGAAARRQEALLVFEDGDPALPLVVGLVQPAAPSMIDLVLEATAPAEDPSPDPEARTAVLDGKRVVLEGEDEVVLRCGEASITLRRNGKIVIRGAYVESHAAGTNRIKGGSVRIN